MANTVKFLTDRFIAFSGIGMIDPAGGVTADANIDMRLKCTIALEDNVARDIFRDCEDSDRTNERITTRVRRLRLTITSVTAQIEAMFAAYFLGEAAAPTGSAQNEIQTLSRSGTVNAGFFTLALTLEGRTAKTTPLAFDATAAEIQDALTAARMKWIQPNDVVVSGGTLQVETATVAGTIGAGGAGNVTVIVTANGMANSPKTIPVAVANNDTAAQVAGKIRTALGADTDVAAFFTVGGSTTAVILTSKAAAANDSTMNIDVDNGTSSGLTTAHTSANTTPGVSAQSWGALGMVMTFGGRFAHMDVPLIVVDNAPAGYTAIGGGGSIVNAQTQAGSNYFHAFTRSTSREKVKFSFALGYLTGSDDPQKYSGFVCESITPSGNRRQRTGLEVSIVGPYTPTDMVGYTIPDCENPTPQLTEDCKVLINSNWETTDVSTLSAPFNDNVPLDDSAYGFDGIEPDLLARAKQVDYDVSAQIFAIESDAISILAENERTQDPVDAKFHFGMPGDRFTILAPETKVKFQTNRFTAVGAAERLAGNFTLSAFKNDQDPPISAEAYISQSVAFLQDS
jgi:hypothetical protein